VSQRLFSDVEMFFSEKIVNPVRKDVSQIEGFDWLIASKCSVNTYILTAFYSSHYLNTPPRALSLGHKTWLIAKQVQDLLTF
jgi:hypothetical protein